MRVRLDRLQRGMTEAMQGVADVVRMGYGSVPRGQGSLLAIELGAGPIAGHRRHARARTIVPPQSIVIRVTDAADGSLAAARVNEYAYTAVGGPASTVTTMRDDMLAQIQAGEAGIVDAVADGADGIMLSGATLGGWRELQLAGDMAADDPVAGTEAVSLTEGTATHVVSLQAYSRGPEPRNGAWAIVSDVLGRLEDPAVVEQLDRWGVGVWQIGSPTNLTAIAGASWESRVSVDVTLAMRSVSARAVDCIEQAQVDQLVLGIGSGKPFLPTDIAGLIMWLRADAGIELEAGKVRRWTSFESNGHVFEQLTASLQPRHVTRTELGGALAVEFSGADDTTGDRLVFTGSKSVFNRLHSGPFTLMLVVDLDAANGYVGSTLRGLPDRNGWELHRNAATSLRWLIGNGSAPTYVVDSTATVGTGRAVIIMSLDTVGSTFAWEINGVEVESGPLAEAVNPADSFGDLTFGDTVLAVDELNGAIAVATFYDSVLSESDKASLRTYAGQFAP